MSKRAVAADVPFLNTTQVDVGLANHHPSKNRIRKTNHQNESLADNPNRKTNVKIQILLRNFMKVMYFNSCHGCDPNELWVARVYTFELHACFKSKG